MSLHSCHKLLMHKLCILNVKRYNSQLFRFYLKSKLHSFFEVKVNVLIVDFESSSVWKLYKLPEFSFKISYFSNQ